MSIRGHRIVFLYSELAGYFLACAETLCQHPHVASVDIVHWPTHSEAPFQFAPTEHCSLHPKEKHNRESLKQLLAQINPTAIICSGWMDSDYNALANAYQKQIPVVLALDNWWTGKPKQRLAALTAPLFIRRCFNRAWVPGEPQIPFAQKLGFSGKSLATGFYCAAPKPFQAIYEKRKTTPPTKNLLYIGRYNDVKGIRELWSAFIKLSQEFPEWELHCIGTGELWDSRAIHPKIIHHGFKQPHELESHLLNTSFFVMPSKKEPWGVVLHEMAIAGLPILVSNAVGAATKFLNPGINGAWIHSEDFISELRIHMSLRESQISKMGEHSHRLGFEWTPLKWAHTAVELIQDE